MTEHRAFILRVRNDEPDKMKQPRWRYILFDSECEYRRGFTSLDQLFKALYMEISGDRFAESAHIETLRAVEEFLGTSSAGI